MIPILDTTDTRKILKKGTHTFVAFGFSWHLIEDLRDRSMARIISAGLPYKGTMVSCVPFNESISFGCILVPNDLAALYKVAFDELHIIEFDWRHDLDDKEWTRYLEEQVNT